MECRKRSSAPYDGTGDDDENEGKGGCCKDTCVSSAATTVFCSRIAVVVAIVGTFDALSFFFSDASGEEKDDGVASFEGEDSVDVTMSYLRLCVGSESLK